MRDVGRTREQLVNCFLNVIYKKTTTTVRGRNIYKSIQLQTVLFGLSGPHQCSADVWDEDEPLKPPRVSHTCSNSSVMPECSNQRTSERAQLLAAMTHPSRVHVLNLHVKQSFVTPKSYI